MSLPYTTVKGRAFSLIYTDSVALRKASGKHVDMPDHEKIPRSDDSDGEKKTGMTHIVTWGPQALKSVSTTIKRKSKGFLLLPAYVPPHLLFSVIGIKFSSYENNLPRLSKGESYNTQYINLTT